MITCYEKTNLFVLAYFFRCWRALLRRAIWKFDMMNKIARQRHFDPWGYNVFYNELKNGWVIDIMGAGSSAVVTPALQSRELVQGRGRSGVQIPSGPYNVPTCDLEYFSSECRASWTPCRWKDELLAFENDNYKCCHYRSPTRITCELFPLKEPRPQRSPSFGTLAYVSKGFEPWSKRPTVFLVRRLQPWVPYFH